MPRSELARLMDMLAEIDAVAEMIQCVDFEDYRADRKLRRAIERCVQIVSEASRHLPSAMKSRHDQPWPEIAGIGNLLRHEYHRIDDLIMWKIAVESLPALRPAVVALLEREQQ